MSEASEAMEQAEHVGHAGHGEHESHGKGPSKAIGVTMAVLGVALALFAALVGQQRTDLIGTMVEQSNKVGLYHTETMKFRVAQGGYELLKSIAPKPDEVARINKTLHEKRGAGGKGDDEDTAELKDLIASATADMADLLTPDAGEITRLRALAHSYKRDMLEAREDAEAYDLKIEAHRDAAEGYEQAQLAAEIGIVIASVALMLASRRVWGLSLLCGAACLGLGGYTNIQTRAKLGAAEAKIERAAKNAVVIEADDEEVAGQGAEARTEHPGAVPAKAEPAKAEPKP